MSSSAACPAETVGLPYALDAARLAQAETLSGENRFARERGVPLFREAFRAYGLPAGEGEPAEAAARLRQRPPQVREEAGSALDEWIDVAADPGYQISEPHLDWLRALAAGPDEVLTREIRAASQEKDPDKRQALLEKVASEADVSKLPPHTLVRLARLLQRAQPPRAAVALRRRALTWLRADLTLLQRLLEKGEVKNTAAIRARLLRWQNEPDLAGLRDVALKTLSVEEQQTCRALWADVRALLAVATGSTPPP